MADLFCDILTPKPNDPKSDKPRDNCLFLWIYTLALFPAEGTIANTVNSNSHTTYHVQHSDGQLIVALINEHRELNKKLHQKRYTKLVKCILKSSSVSGYGRDVCVYMIILGITVCTMQSHNCHDI